MMPAWQTAFTHLLDSQVFDVPSQEDVFNFYRDRISGLDLPDGPTIRRRNLLSSIKFIETPRVLLVGEAPGPRGARFSGVPFASEQQLLDSTFGLSGERSSQADTPYKEASATIFRRVLAPYQDSIFVWNSFPLLPHLPDKPMSMRYPRPNEIAAYQFLIEKLVEWLQPELVLAVGRRAELAFKKIGLRHKYVRHPSHGGARDFKEAVDLLLQPLLK